MNGLSRDHVVWAYRILLDRDPESESAIEPKMRGYQQTSDLRHDIMTSPEFQEKNPDFAQTNSRNVVIKPLASGVRVFVDLADHAIGLNIIREQFEQAELAFAIRSVKPGSVAVDGGAHVGLYALHMAQAAGPTGHVYAFEPFPGNADLLEASIAENGFRDRLTLARAALGATPARAEMNYAPHTLNSGGAFLIPDAGPGLAGHERLTVEVRALDTIDLRRPVSFIKLDVEGAEPQALRGAARLLAEDRPVLLCEVHHEQLARVSGSTPDDLFAWLAGLGYRAHEVTPAGELGRRLDAPPTALVSTVAFVAT